MNCQDITDILDERDLGALSALERRHAEAHMAHCADCARGWRTQQAVLAAPVPALPASLARGCRELVAAARIQPRPVAGRTLVVGGLLLLGGVAAAFLSQQLGVFSSERSAVVGPPVADQAPPAAGETPASGAALEPAATAVAAGVVPAPPAEPAGTQPVIARGFSIAVSLDERNPTNAGVHAATAELYASLLDALRAIPGATVEEIEPEFPDATEVAGIAPPALVGSIGAAQFAVESVRADAEGVELRSSARVGTILVAGDDPVADTYSDEAMRGVVNVILGANIDSFRIEAGPAPDGRDVEADPYDYRIAIVSRADGLQGERWLISVSGSTKHGAGLSFSHGAPLAPPLDAAALAATTGPWIDPQQTVESLRYWMLRHDTDFLAEVGRRVLDPGALETKRTQAAGRLLDPDNGPAAAAWVESHLEALIGIASSDASLELRAAIWRGLRGASYPELIEPLALAARGDGDSESRLEAVITLSGFDHDPRAREALETVARSAPRTEAGMHARWAIADNAGRRDLVIAALLDTSLPDRDRLAYVNYRHPLGEIRTLQDIDIGQAVDSAVASVLSELVDRADAVSRAELLRTLAPIENASLTDIVLDHLIHDGDRSVRIAALTALQSRLDEPEVRVAVEQVGRNDPAPELGALANRWLADNAGSAR